MVNGTFVKPPSVNQRVMATSASHSKLKEITSQAVVPYQERHLDCHQPLYLILPSSVFSFLLDAQIPFLFLQEVSTKSKYELIDYNCAYYIYCQISLFICTTHNYNMSSYTGHSQESYLELSLT